MNITSLECPSCGGKLKPMKGNPQIMVCEYCGKQCMVDNNVTVNYHIHQPSSAQTMGTTGNNGKNSSLSSGFIIAGSLLMCILLVIIGNLQSTTKKSSYSPSTYTMPAELTAEIEEEELPSEYSDLFSSFVETLFKKEASLVTESDLRKIKYICIDVDTDSSTIEYSFQSPYEDTSFQTETMVLESLQWSSVDFSALKGLEKIDLTYLGIEKVPFEDLTELKGISCRDVAPEYIAELLPFPEQILELSLDDPGSINGLSAFENIEILSLESLYTPDLKQLVPLKHLKSLSIQEDEEDSFSDSEDTSSWTDYSPLSALTGLEKLALSSSSIRDFGFLKPLVNLADLSIAETESISLEPLRDMVQLTVLNLTDNNSLQDYTVLEDLINLRTLVLDKSTSQPDPDLSSLRQLEYLDICGFMSVSFLNGMDNLKQLFIHSCNLDEISFVSGLTGLESFTCYSVWTYAVPLTDVRFIDAMPNLKTLDFSGNNGSDEWDFYRHQTEIYGDISNVFNHPGLEKLVLNSCQFAIDFDKLIENPTLKHLEMKEISLKENFYVECYNGMMDIWYDDVSLNENLDFLTKYPALEVLRLDKNQITEIQFASSLSNLKRLSLNDNYITELTPLNQLEYLEFLDIRKNPITTTMEADDSIQILK